MKIGKRFQDETKYNAGVSPPTFDESGETLALPAVNRALGSDANLWTLIESRRSKRSFSSEPISLQSLANLLWAMQGVTGRSHGHGLRASPSAGALYPDDTYCVAHRVDGLGPGVYKYLPAEHRLVTVQQGDLRAETAHAGLRQSMLGDCAVAFIWAATLERALWKYRQRTYRYIYLDAGHICAHLYLACEALGLGCCGVAAFYDDAVNALIDADGETETAVYMAAVGMSEG